MSITETDIGTAAASMADHSPSSRIEAAMTAAAIYCATCGITDPDEVLARKLAAGRAAQIVMAAIEA